MLEFGLRDEWGALCELLEVGVLDHPYPRGNEGGDWILKMCERAWKAAAVRFFRGGLPVAGCRFCARRLGSGGEVSWCSSSFEPVD